MGGKKSSDFYHLTEVCVFIQVLYILGFVRILPLSKWKQNRALSKLLNSMNHFFIQLNFCVIQSTVV